MEEVAPDNDDAAAGGAVRRRRRRRRSRGRFRLVVQRIKKSAPDDRRTLLIEFFCPRDETSLSRYIGRPALTLTTLLIPFCFVRGGIRALPRPSPMPHSTTPPAPGPYHL